MGIDDTPSRGRPMNDRRPQPVARMSVSEMRGGAGEPWMSRSLSSGGAEPVIGPPLARTRWRRSVGSSGPLLLRRRAACDDAYRRPAASIRAIYLRQFVTDYSTNILFDCVARPTYISPSLAHRGASPETVPLAERGVVSRGGGSQP